MKFTQSVELNKNGNLKKEIGNDLWEVQTPFIWLIDYENKLGEKIVINKGFVTNFGSIPRLFWLIFDKNKYVAYILHDGLLNERGNELIKKFKKNPSRKRVDEIIKIAESVDTGGKKYNRFQADWILFKAMEVEGASITERLLVYGAVSFWSLLVYFRNFLKF